MANDEYIVPIETVAQLAGWKSARVKELLAEGVLPTRTNWLGQVFTTKAVADFYLKNPPPKREPEKFTVKLQTFAELLKKSAAEIESNGLVEVRTIGGEKYVSQSDYAYYFDRRQYEKQPTYRHSRYSDDI